MSSTAVPQSGPSPVSAAQIRDLAVRASGLQSDSCEFGFGRAALDEIEDLAFLEADVVLEQRGELGCHVLAVARSAAPAPATVVWSSTSRSQTGSSRVEQGEDQLLLLAEVARRLGREETKERGAASASPCSRSRRARTSAWWWSCESGTRAVWRFTPSRPDLARAVHVDSNCDVPERREGPGAVWRAACFRSAASATCGACRPPTFSAAGPSLPEPQPSSRAQVRAQPGTTIVGSERGAGTPVIAATWPRPTGESNARAR